MLNTHLPEDDIDPGIITDIVFYFIWNLKKSTLRYNIYKIKSSLVTQLVKNLPAMRESQVRSLSWEDLLEEGMATHSSIPARRIPWTEEPGGLQSTDSQRVGHDWATHTAQVCVMSVTFSGELCVLSWCMEPTGGEIQYLFITVWTYRSPRFLPCFPGCLQLWWVICRDAGCDHFRHARGGGRLPFKRVQEPSLTTQISQAVLSLKTDAQGLAQFLLKMLDVRKETGRECHQGPQAQSCLTLCDPVDCSPARLLCPWDSPGQDTGGGCHALLQGIFLTQGSNPRLLYCRQVLYHLSHVRGRNSSEYFVVLWSDVLSLCGFWD